MWDTPIVPYLSALGDANTNKAAPRQPDKQLQTISNAHTYQLQGNTIGLHFAPATHKGTKKLQDTNLEIPLSPHKRLEGSEINTDSKGRNSYYTKVRGKCAGLQSTSGDTALLTAQFT